MLLYAIFYYMLIYFSIYFHVVLYKPLNIGMFYILSVMHKGREKKTILLLEMSYIRQEASSEMKVLKGPN